MSKPPTPKKLKPKDCRRCILVRDIHSIVARIDIAPTMLNIHFEGERFFRMPRTCGLDADGTPSWWYLGESYGQKVLAEIAARKEQES